MKRILHTLTVFIVLIAISPLVSAETYICKITIPPTHSGDIALYETHLFERNQSNFKHSVDYQSKYPFNIIRETARYILLHRDTRIVMINKLDLRLGQYWIDSKPSYKPDFGTCRVK
ncbi:MAG TPA: hypothetical protein DHV86_04010 [Methylophilaceae bacterium]|jgi:hypothetical protein|nr:hypothetical protein [Methylophilaceae bacterium]